MKNIFRDFLKPLRIGDLVTIVFLTILSVICIIYFNTIEVWWVILITNFLISVFIVFISYHSRENHGIIKIIRDWYWYPFILVIFKEIYVLIQSLSLPDYDSALIKIDRWLFGLDPTVWLHQYSHPVITEILQICYSSFYLILFFVPLWSYINKKHEEFNYSFFMILLGFYISYIGYILVPAIGPRFTLHNFTTVDTELPGIFITDICRQVINMGESIPSNTANAALLAQRDCFPSGHTEMTIISIFLSFKFQQKIRWVILIIGTGLIIGTVYLRYHYVIDIIAGVLCAIMVILISPGIQKIWDIFRLKK